MAQSSCVDPKRNEGHGSTASGQDVTTMMVRVMMTIVIMEMMSVAAMVMIMRTR